MQCQILIFFADETRFSSEVTIAEIWKNCWRTKPAAVLITPQGAESPASGRIRVIGALVFSLI